MKFVLRVEEKRELSSGCFAEIDNLIRLRGTVETKIYAYPDELS